MWQGSTPDSTITTRSYRGSFWATGSAVNCWSTTLRGWNEGARQGANGTKDQGIGGYRTSAPRRMDKSVGWRIVDRRANPRSSTGDLVMTTSYFPWPIRRL